MNCGRPGAGADEHRVVTFFFQQFVNGDGASDNDIGFKFHAHGAHIVDLLANDFLRQPELRNAIHQHAADFVQRLENMHRVPFLHQIAGRGQPRRPTAYDRHFLPRRRRLHDVLRSKCCCS
jgi:hypothetical protein